MRSLGLTPCPPLFEPPEADSKRGGTPKLYCACKPIQEFPLFSWSFRHRTGG